MHLHNERVLLLLKLLKDPSLSHYLHDFVIFLDSVLTHHFHCVELSRGFMSNEQNFRETPFSDDFLYQIVIERLILSLLNFGEFMCWYLNSLQLLVRLED